MSVHSADVETEMAVTAIARHEDEYRAVQLAKRGASFGLVWTRADKAAETDFAAFAANCGLTRRPEIHRTTERRTKAVVAFESAGTVFYCLDVPAVKDDEVAAIVKLQAESRLPLPADQVEMAWRKGELRNGQVTVTMAAARRQHVQRFVEEVRPFGPDRILLDCEALVKVWRVFFGGSDSAAVVVSAAARNTKVCLADGGRLINAVSLDAGVEDFSAAQRPADRTRNAERFAQDARSVMQLFGYSDVAPPPVFVLSNGDSATENIAACLRSAGLDAKTALPETQKFAAQPDLGADQMYAYRLPIGLASMVLDGDRHELNIFERLYKPPLEQTKKRWFYSTSVTAALAGVMLVAAFALFFAVDVADNSFLSRLEAKPEFRRLVQQQKLVRAIARQRPDLLGLLSEINSSESEGILLDSLRFRRGQPVSISGQADGPEQLFKFEKDIQGAADITSVKMTYSKEPKGEKLKFTITFHYGSFTSKKGRV